MRRARLVWLALLVPAGLGRAQTLGEVFTVATGVSEYAVASDSRGGFVVAWTDRGDNGGERVHARRYSRSAVALGDPFVLGRAGNGDSASLAAASLGPGSYVVAWSRLENGAGHGLARRIGPQGVGGLKRLGAAGTAVAVAGVGGGEWALGVSYPRATSGFGFGSIWVTLRAEGGAVRRAFRATASGFAPALASSSAGSFLLAYRAARPGKPESVQYRLYSASGLPLASSQATATDDDIASRALLAASGKGRFVVGWIERQTLRLRFYRPLARPVGAAVDTGLEASAASLAMDPAGTVLAAFSLGSDCCELFPIQGRRFERDGRPTDESFAISLSDRPPSAAALGDGQFVVVWREGDALRGRRVRWWAA